MIRKSETPETSWQVMPLGSFLRRNFFKNKEPGTTARLFVLNEKQTLLAYGADGFINRQFNAHSIGQAHWGQVFMQTESQAGQLR